MQVKEVSIKSVIPAERNVRMHNDSQIVEYARSLEQFGQIRPIVVDEKNEILCCNGLYHAAMHLGWDKVKVVQMTSLTEAQKKKLMIADNRLFELGSYNNDVLDEFFLELKDDLDIPGYDEETLQMIVGDMESVNEQIMEYGILEDSRVEEINNNKNFLAQKIEKAETGAHAMGSGQSMAGANAIHESAKGEDERVYAVCPNCGHKVWL